MRTILTEVVLPAALMILTLGLGMYAVACVAR